MRQVGGLAIASIMMAAGIGFAAEAPLTPDQAAVIQVIQDAYVDGIHNYRRVEAVRQGFHPEFEMLLLREGSLSKLPISTWVETLERSNRTNPLPADHAPTTVARYLLVDVTGDAAAVKLELLREDKVVFTDYLSLYRFPEGWRIVGKVFHRHP